MSFAEAVRTTKEGTVIDLEVSPGSRSTVVPSGYNPWRKRIEVRLMAPPEKGRANDELIRALADIFGIPSTGIEITSGATNSRKSVLIRGVGAETVIKLLEARMDG